MSSPEKLGLYRQLSRALVRFYYPRVEVTGGDLIPRTGPVLLVANHPNSLIDPVLLGLAAQRPVKLMAKAPLFNVPVFGAALRGLGMVPAYRGSDDAKQVSKNLESLATAAREVAAGSVMGIFPEGKSHDATQLALVRSGAARLALQAVAAGATDLKIVPVGLNYERKERFRTAVWIKVGRPIDAGRWLQMHGGDEHRAMRTLTQEIGARLKHCVTHLDDAKWEPLLTDVEALLPPAPGGRRMFGGLRTGAVLATLHQRKRVADAINAHHQRDPARAAEAAGRVASHVAALRAAGLTADARLFSLRGFRLLGSMTRDGILMLLGLSIGLIGLAYHLLPYGIVRLIAGRVAGEGRMVVALSRLLLSLPVYAAWYAFVWWRMSLYFLPWVAWTWAALMPFAGLMAVGAVRRLRVALPYWWAEIRLLLNRQRASELRAEHAAIGRMLDEFAAGEKLPTRIPKVPSVIYRPPWWVTVTASAALFVIAAVLGAWLMRDRPLELTRQSAPALHEMAAAELTERLESDERALLAVIDGLDALEARFRKFETALGTGERSYYRPEDDDEIRRMLVSYLSYRTALLRMVWYYQRNDQLDDERTRLRALLLHYTAAALAYDYAARFVAAFENQAVAIRKLNEGEPRWDLAPGTFDAMRASLAHAAHRRWLENGWQNYNATLPRWREHGLRDAEPQARFHKSIAVAAENTARLSEKLFHYKVQTAISDVGQLTRAGWYRSNAVVATWIGDTKVREPRHGHGLIAPPQFAALRTKLRPGDIVLERHNWFLSNAFLPGFWPHAALYVGTIDDLRVLGLEQDPRVAKHLERFARRDAAGHPYAIIEAQSEGIIFTSAEISIGHSDSVAVLRPKMTPAQTKEVIAQAFSHVGKPYDFDFDFFSADKLVCTELVFRAYGSHLEFPLVDVLGRKTLPAIEMVRYWASPAGGPQLEFIAFLDGDESTGTCTECDVAAFKQTITRPALTWRQ